MYLLFLFCFLPDGELVLRNGKVLRYQGEYIQEGQMVRFTDQAGKYLTLPSKIIDFEKTQARIDGKKAKSAAAKEAKRLLAEEERRRASRMVADLVADDAVGTRELSMSNDEIDEKGHVRNDVNYGHTDYDDDYYTDDDVDDSGNDKSVDAAVRKKEFFVSRIKSLKGIEKNLIRKITQLSDEKERVSTKKNSSGGSTSGNTSREIDDKIRTLEEDLYRAKDKISSLEMDARRAGFYDL